MIRAVWAWDHACGGGERDQFVGVVDAEPSNGLSDVTLDLACRDAEAGGHLAVTQAVSEKRDHL
jgi:hypothetical protein